MAVRTATARWNGGLKDGDGTLSVGSGVLTDEKYTFTTRFEEEPGTNPEELLGAAHAGCFTMALGADLERAGTPAETLFTSSKIHLRGGDGGPRIDKIELVLTGRVPGIDQAAFEAAAQDTLENCIVSKALSVEDMTVEATLES